MNNTEIIFVIDRSGSMSNLVNDTIGGFNGFLASQKAIEGKATLTTVLFSTSWKFLHDGMDIQEVQPMTMKDYQVGGGTAMLDAIGEIINRVQDRHDEMGTEKPDKVLFVITTDGEENSSRKYTKAQIEKMIKHQTNGHGWEFLFLGANMDAVKEAQSIGITYDRAVSYDYSSIGTDALYGTVTAASKAVRTASLDGISMNAVYNATLSDLQTADNVEACTAKTYTDTLETKISN
jgi:uncharacterized protein YegL